LFFCPITDGKNGKSLSAKTILGNRAQLSKWQTDYHTAMSARWPEMQRGLSSLETKRKHIPVWLFKQAERLDKQFAEISGVLEGINPFNAPKKKEAALAAFEKLMPEAARFTASVKQYDGYIKELEAAEKAKSQKERGNER
jgi:hypothetical protein